MVSIYVFCLPDQCGGGGGAESDGDDDGDDFAWEEKTNQRVDRQLMNRRNRKGKYW